MSIDESLVAIAAKAIYGAQVKQARESISRVAFDARELPRIFKRLTGESQTAQVLIFCSYLEDRVRELIKVRLKHLGSIVQEDAIFGSNGPLSTFGNRLLLSYQLGWLSPKHYKSLNALRKIRNHFAHRAFAVSISDPDIAAQLVNIDFDVFAILNTIRTEFAARGEVDPIPPEEEISADAQLLCKLALLATSIFVDYLILPAAVAYQVSPHDVAGSYDDGPEILRELQRQGADALLLVLNSHPSKK